MRTRLHLLLLLALIGLSASAHTVVERDGYHVIFLYDKNSHRSVWTYVDVLYSNLGSFAITGCERKETTLKEGSCVIVSGNLNLADDTEVTISREGK